jgi:hypothetical protein
MAGYCCYCLYGDSLLLLLLSGLSPPVRRPLHDCQGTRHDRQPTHPHAFLVCHYANRKRTSLSFRLIQFNFPCVFCATRADLPAPPCSYLLAASVPWKPTLFRRCKNLLYHAVLLQHLLRPPSDPLRLPHLCPLLSVPLLRFFRPEDIPPYRLHL